MRALLLADDGATLRDARHAKADRSLSDGAFWLFVVSIGRKVPLSVSLYVRSLPRTVDYTLLLDRTDGSDHLIRRGLFLTHMNAVHGLLAKMKLTGHPLVAKLSCLQPEVAKAMNPVSAPPL